MRQKTSRFFNFVEKFYQKVSQNFAIFAFLCVVRNRGGNLRCFLRARFYRSTKICFSLILPLQESCWGVPSPNPAYAAYAAEKSLKIFFRIFQKQFRFTPCFSPISERTPRTERRFLPCENDITRRTAAG